MIITNHNFNLNYKFKLEGFFYKYIYLYKIYKENINIGFEHILNNKNFTIFINFKLDKEKRSLGLGLLHTKNFKTNDLFINFINKSINDLILLYKIENKNILEIELCIWEFIKLWNQFIETKLIKEEKKKYNEFNKKINEIIELKCNKNVIFNSFLLQSKLKTLKNLLEIKNVEDERKKENCIKHLYNLIMKWQGNNKESLELWIFKVISKYKKT